MDDEQMQMVEDCEKRESKLTAWERAFIDSMRSRLPEPGLTPDQASKLEQIWDKVTS